MIDIGMSIIDNCIQLSLENGDLVADDGLETAILISLFTDQRVTDEELPIGTDDKRGWWGDLFPFVQGDKIGSKLWTLFREGKVNNSTAAQVETLALDALQWLIDDGVASSVEVLASTTEDKKINIAVKITKQTGESSRFDIIWDNQKIKRG